MKKLMTILSVAAALFASCKMFTQPSDDNAGGGGSKPSGARISQLSLTPQTLSVSVGGMKYATLSISPSSIRASASLSWTYDHDIIDATVSNSGAVVTGKAEGQTNLTVSGDGISATAIITVSGYSETYETDPYIYSNYTTVQTTPGEAQQVYVSLYGGDASDIDGYTWTSDNAGVVDLAPNGQYCQIKAKEEGYARVKVTHVKAAYPYYIGVYCFADISKTCYLTSSQNIVTLTKSGGEARVDVSLVNDTGSGAEGSYTWEILDDDGSFTLTANGNQAILTPVKKGLATLRARHTRSQFPLDFVVRTIEIVENVSIKTSSTLVYVRGTEEPSVRVSLDGYRGNYSPDEFSFEIRNENVVTGVSGGGEIILRGEANGSTELVVSHPLAQYSRTILIVCQDQARDAVDASLFITTSQNYVKTKVGAEQTEISVTLKGGEPGDKNNFVWTVKSGSQFVSLSTTNGSVVSENRMVLRSAMQTYESGSAWISPIAEGVAIIEVSHPKVYYPTEIMVKVYSANAIFDEPLYFSGSGLVYLLNGETTDYTLSLNGVNKSPTDEQNTAWTVDNQSFNLLANGCQARISANGSGINIGSIIATNPKCEHEKKITVASADTLEELKSIRLLYADKYYYSLSVGEEIAIPVNSEGLGDANDFSNISWRTSNSSIATVEKDALSPLLAKVAGVSAGQATITVETPGCNSVDFEVTVYPEGVHSAVVEQECYFTTSQNVVSIASSGVSKTVSVTAVNLPTGQKGEISWTSSDESVCSVIGNGERATVSTLREGESVISVSHPKSANTLKIYVRVGSEYVITNENVLYISASSDVMTFLADDQAGLLTCALVSSLNGVEDGATDFFFSIDNESVARITAQYPNGKAFVAPVAAGQCELTVTHPDAQYSKKVLVVVGNTAEELAAFKYLTTADNVVTVAKGGHKAVTVEVKNSSDVIVSGYSWSSENPLVASTSSTAATAQIVGNEIGTTKIHVANTACQYSLEIYVNVVDANSAAANPYIQLTTNVLTLSVSQDWTTVTADLVGGSEADFANFAWQSTDASVVQLVGQNEQAKLRAVGAGQCYVQVSHPRAAYPAQLLVVCDTATQSVCSISVAESIITMKPTDSVKTITATLVNGDALDKYNFRWSLDVYDVIDLSYSANYAQITPLKTGQVTLTITHPKASYPQQVVIKVSNWTSFAFGSAMTSIDAGKSTFVSMQIPSSPVACHVEYETLNPSVCQISGTDSVCQITGVAEGTTSVKAYLVATATNARQSESVMLVSVNRADTAATFITASKTIYTIEKDLSTTLYASITGENIDATDAYQLQWKSSDESVARISGASSTGVYVGNSAYVTALQSGECTITISHEKSVSNLVFHIIVPGEAEQSISLSKTYLQIEKGFQSDLKATISDASARDYQSIEWTISRMDDLQVARILGSGQTVSIYAIAAGEVTVTAQLPNGARATCQVIVENDKSFVFENQTVRVCPTRTKSVNYEVSPFDAGLQWLLSDGTYATFEDKGNSNGRGRVEITGVAEGTTTLSCVTSYGNRATLQIVCSWDYNLYVNKSKISGVPIQSYSCDFQVHPETAVISVDDSLVAVSNVVNNGDGTGTITFTPRSEGNETVAINAFNPATGQVFKSTSVELDFKYNGITFMATPIASQCVGSFSKFDAESKVVHIGDGEMFTMKFDPIETMASAQITGVSFQRAGVSSGEGEHVSVFESDTRNHYWTIKHDTDYVDEGYLIYAYYDFGSPGCIESPYNRTYVKRSTWDTGCGRHSHSSCHWRWSKSETVFHNAERDYTFAYDGDYKAVDGWWHGWIHTDGGNVFTGKQGHDWGECPVRDVVGQQDVGYLVIQYTHNGRSESASLAIRVEVRKCPAVYPYDMSQDWKFFSASWY